MQKENIEFKLIETCLEKCPDEKPSIFIAMILDLLYSEKQEECQFAMTLFDSKFIRRSQIKAICCIEAYMYYRASGGHIWHKTYDFIQRRLYNALITDDDRSQDKLCQTLLRFLSISERPNELIQCIKLFIEVEANNPNLFHLSHSIINLAEIHRDRNTIQVSLHYLEILTQSSNFTKFDNEIKEHVNLLIKRLNIHNTPIFNSQLEYSEKQAHSKPSHLDIAVALSGGGFRASLFHAGFLSSLDAYLKQRSNINIKRISAVSGGSIISAYYCLGNNLSEFKNIFLEDEHKKHFKFIKEIFREKIPWYRKERGVADLLGEIFFGKNNIKLNSLKSEYPSLNIVSYDYEKGNIIGLSKYSLKKHPEFLLQDAIAASCAFPFVLKPLELKQFEILDYTDEFSDSSQNNGKVISSGRKILYDGGVADNTGLLAIAKEKMFYNTVISSDCGALMYDEKERPGVLPYRRFLDSAFGQINSLLKKEMSNYFGPYFINADINNDVKNISAFHFPTPTEVNTLFQEGQESSEKVIEKIKELI